MERGGDKEAAWHQLMEGSKIFLMFRFFNCKKDLGVYFFSIYRTVFL
jgi:hypothetical protein